MAKIYYNKYHEAVESGEMTVDEVIELVPARWKQAVRDLFNS